MSADPQDDGSMLTATDAAQARAADPRVSAWVNANAGSGKTYVLTLRVQRLLLGGTRPDKILCLTYTKATAADMSKGVFKTLADWVTKSDKDLEKQLTTVLRRAPTADELRLSRTLFAAAIETPGGFKVQTIHAFCERLLQRFPLEAGVPPGFKILDDQKGRELITRAIDATLVAATENKNSPLGKALTAVIRYAADQTFDTLITKALSERTFLDVASRLELDGAGDDFAAVEKILRLKLGAPLNVSAESIIEAQSRTLSDNDLVTLRDVLAGGSAADVKSSLILADAIKAATPREKALRLARYFMTQDGRPQPRLLTAASVARNPAIAALAVTAQTAFAELESQRKAVEIADATVALYRLSGAVLQRYTDAKAAAGALDFDDLIARTNTLLSDKSAAAWVLYKLDGGLDHILVDEAQDTSPTQWAIISALAREFYAGDGAQDRDNSRSTFAVGDEKQSIYSFQGAAPEEFAKTGKIFEGLAKSAKRDFARVPLTTSFRSVVPVLEAVDRVFAVSTRTPGLTTDGGVVRHVAKRAGEAGLVELWPVFTVNQTPPTSPWQPFADTSVQSPANQLAEAIAQTIEKWLASKELLRSENRPIEAGDILILVRKRNPFAVPMIAALKAKGIAVAGSDRMALTEQLAVMDLLVLGDFLTLPEDDLALATVLKGPLFGLDDDDLMTLAIDRKRTLWKALLDHADHAALFKYAAETLRRWRAKADFLPPFEFFSSVLDRDGGRTKMLHRLGPEAADAIDEFLDLALRYDEAAPPSLSGFLADLRSGTRDVKRDMSHGRNEVRVMTVHGAKGLEAPIVFLPDTCTTSSGDSNAARLLTLTKVNKPALLPDPFVWPVKDTAQVAAVRSALSDKKSADRDERNRLLYVAMTRARDRLYVAGFDGARARPTDCWYDLVSDALRPLMTEVPLLHGGTGWRIEADQANAVEAPKQNASGDVTKPIALPAFATTRAAAERQLSVPLAPSRLEPYAPDADGEPLVHPVGADPAEPADQTSPLTMGEPARFLRGTLTHALLEHLPSIDPAQREAVAAAFVARRGAALSQRARQSVVSETLGVLSEPAFAPLFAPSSRAEVAISAMIPRPAGRGPAMKLSGQIDRLAVTDDCVLIVDYKTNRPPPTDVAKVADAYLFQLAAYVLGLREIYPGKTVRAALLWTDGPRLMEIPTAVIDNAILRLWEIDLASLDGA